MEDKKIYNFEFSKEEKDLLKKINISHLQWDMWRLGESLAARKDEDSRVLILALMEGLWQTRHNAEFAEVLDTY